MATEGIDLLDGPEGVPQSEYVDVGDERYKTVVLFLPSLVVSRKLDLCWSRLGGLSSEIRFLNEMLSIQPAQYAHTIKEFSSNMMNEGTIALVEEAFQRADYLYQIQIILNEVMCFINGYKETLSSISRTHKGASINKYVPHNDLFNDTSYTSHLSLWINGFMCVARHCPELAEVLRFELLCPALLCTPNVGIRVICSIAVNRPECFEDIITVLIRNEDYNTRPGRVKALCHLSRLSNYAALYIRDACIEAKDFPEVVFDVTLRVLHDEVSFVTSLAATWNGERYVSYFAVIPESKLAEELRITIWNSIRNAKHDEQKLYDGLRALCALHCGIGVLGTEAEQDELIPGLIRESQGTEAHRLLFACLYGWPYGRRETIGTCVKALADAGRVPELFLLAATLLHTDKGAHLLGYIEAIMDFSLCPLSQNSQGLAQILTREILPLDVCCVRAVQLPHVTEDTPTPTADATFHGIYTLLEQGLFTKYEVDAGSWLVPQILSGCLPAHPLFLDAISIYASGAVRQLMRGEQSQGRLTLISEAEARSVLGMGQVPLRKCRGLIPLPLSCGLPRPKIGTVTTGRTTGDTREHPTREGTQWGSGARYLVAFFILEYVEALAIARGGPNTQKGGGGGGGWPRGAYPDDFLWDMPIQEILAEARADPRCAGGLAERLGALVMSQFPQLVDPELLILRAIEQVGGANATRERKAATPRRLTGREDERELEVYAAHWLDEFSRDPWELSLEFVNTGAGRETPRALTHADIVTDLTSVLRAVDRKALRSPSLVRIVLTVLKMYRAAARKMLTEQEALQPQRVGDIQSFAVAQDTVLVQLLLEACLEDNPALPPSAGPAALESVRALVCDFVHHIFIEDPDLIVAVHTQGYNERLTPVTVRGIPSVYLCQEFLPALMARPRLKDRIFAIRLGVTLAQQYRTEALYKAMGLFIDSVRNFHKAPSAEDPTLFLTNTIPLLVPLVKAFPCYKSSALETLQELLDAAAADAYTNTDLIRIIVNTTNEINTTDVATTSLPAQ